jgi:hypothetical protein
MTKTQRFVITDARLRTQPCTDDPRTITTHAPGQRPRSAPRASTKSASTPSKGERTSSETCDSAITHPVVEVERWLKGKAERAASFGAVATNVQDFVAVDGSNTVAITADIHDKAAAHRSVRRDRVRGPLVDGRSPDMFLP